MASPYISEIRMFAGSFAPDGWVLCDGRELLIAEHDALFVAIGTTYGGDGEETFAVPDLRGRVPIHQSGAHTRGEKGGVEQVTLSTQQIPSHSHALQGSSAQATSNDPTDNVAGSLPVQVNRTAYGSDPPPEPLDPTTIGPVGGGEPHTNLQPYGCVAFIMSLFGVFPSPQGPVSDLEQLFGEIRIFPYDFTPVGWAPCEGQLMPISQNTALFSILGISYGGNGKSHFALPDLTGAAPLGPGQGPGLSDYVIGERGGEAGVALTTDEIPAHAHTLSVSVQQSVERQPAGQLFAGGVGVAFYDEAADPSTTLASEALATTGASAPHENRQPFLGMRYCIALQGTFPSI